MSLVPICFFFFFGVGSRVQQADRALLLLIAQPQL
jgi:hypothetical protein